MTSFLRAGRSRSVAIWLFVVAALVLVMVVVGGATRLTDSGLSITQWRPVTGAIPPLNEAAWQAEFARYRQIPQYQLLNPSMSLADFRTIYWWEWTHRFLGRLVGLAFAVPMLVFWIRRRLPFQMKWRCSILLLLGGLQGLVGWWMVASGLSDRVSVAPERLTVHLALALLLFCGLMWTGLDAWFGPSRSRWKSPWGPWSLAVLAAAYVQSLLGALVAGNDAGRVNTDWPMMNGRLFPSDYSHVGGLWQTLAHSQAAVQFNHRIGGYLLLALAAGVGVAAFRSRWADSPVRGLAVLTLAAVGLQAILGIVTLWSAAPLSLSLAHQFGAVVVLLSATVFAWRARRS